MYLAGIFHYQINLTPSFHIYRKTEMQASLWKQVIFNLRERPVIWSLLQYGSHMF